MEQDNKKQQEQASRSGDVPVHPQERNLHDRQGSDFDSENVPEPVSFEQEDEETRMVRDEDLSRIEQEQPKADDMDDIKDSQ